MGEKAVAIIGARLNSSRLPRKHLLPLAGKPLIARVVDRLRCVDGLDGIILATTADDYNAELVSWATSYGVEVVAYRGDVDDLVGRIDSVVEAHDPAIIVYVCGDCPLIEPKTLEKAITAVRADPSNEFAALAERPDGRPYIHEGFDLFRRAFWDRMTTAADVPFEREHIGAVYKHSGKVQPQNIATFTDDDIYAACEQRISVDTASDYRFMCRVYDDWYQENDASSMVDLASVIKGLQHTPDITAINQSVRQRQVGESVLKVAILSEAGQQVGLGHLSRMLVAAQALQDTLSASVKLYLRGDPVKNDALALLPHEWVADFESVHPDCDALVVDVKTMTEDITGLLAKMPRHVAKVAVDQPLDCAEYFDFLWQPCMYMDSNKIRSVAHKLDYGWHTFLLKSAPVPADKCGSEGQKVVVLTGGTDAAGLGQVWPSLLEQYLPDTVQVDWVQGPFAPEPVLEAGSRLNLLQNQQDLPAILPRYDAALVVFGVSYFECLLAGLPTVVSNAAGAATPTEWANLKDTFGDVACDTETEAMQQLCAVLQGTQKELKSDVQQQLVKGPVNFANRVMSLIEKKRVPYADAS